MTTPTPTQHRQLKRPCVELDEHNLWNSQGLTKEIKRSYDESDEENLTNSQSVEYERSIEGPIFDSDIAIPIGLPVPPYQSVVQQNEVMKQALGMQRLISKAATSAVVGFPPERVSGVIARAFGKLPTEIREEPRLAAEVEDEMAGIEQEFPVVATCHQQPSSIFPVFHLPQHLSKILIINRAQSFMSHQGADSRRHGGSRIQGRTLLKDDGFSPRIRQTDQFSRSKRKTRLISPSTTSFGRR